MEKPLIILGGNIFACLLACRLKEVLPQIPFIICEESSTLGNHLTTFFSQKDCENSMKWLRPFISNSWSQYKINLSANVRVVSGSYHMIEPRHFHELVNSKLGDHIRLNRSMTPENALKEGSYVLDVRNFCHYKRNAYKKNFLLQLELLDQHNLFNPVIFEMTNEMGGVFRSFSYYPLDKNKLVVNESWYSDNNSIELNQMRREICDFIYSKGWRISKIVREESTSCDFPLSPPVLRNEGERIISLAGLFHDTTGCCLVFATQLIEKMMMTSFRYGEIKQVVKEFRKEIEYNRKFFRNINRQIIEGPSPHIFETIYSSSSTVINRFCTGKMSYIDRSRLSLEKSGRSIGYLAGKIRGNLTTMIHDKGLPS